MAEEHLTQAKSEVAPLWVGKTKLRVRIALPDESAFFSEAKNNGQPSDGLMLVYLVELDGNETDEQSVNPGAFSADPNLICPTQRKVASSARG